MVYLPGVVDNHPSTPPPQQGIVAGYVSKSRPAPTSFDDPVYVIVPDHGIDTPYGPVTWPAAHGLTMPTQGSPVWLAFDGQGAPIVVWWTGAYKAPPSPPPPAKVAPPAKSGAPINALAAPYGAAGDGVTDDTATIERAINDAALVGLDVLVPWTVGGYKTKTGIQMVTGVDLLGSLGPRSLEHNGLGTTIIGSPGYPALKLPNTALGGFTQRAACSIANLNVTGEDGIVALNGGVGFHLEGVTINVTRYGILANGFIQSWTGDRVEIIGGTIGFYFPPTAGTGGDAARMDDCDFSRFYFQGQTQNPINIDVVSGTSIRWPKLRTVTSAQDGVVIAGGLQMFTIDDWNCEGIGYSGPTTYVAPTTGTITLGTPTVCAVASGVGIANGSTVTVAGAGVAGADLVSLVSSGGGTASLILATPASTAVAGADVRIGRYSELKVVHSARGTPTLINISRHISGGNGNAGRGDCNLRYSIDNTPGGLITLAGSYNTVTAPHYDPAGGIIVDGEGFNNSLRRPPTTIGLTDVSPWRALTPINGWSNAGSGTAPLAWRRRGSHVYLRGVVVAGAGASSPLANFTTDAAPVVPADTDWRFGLSSIAGAVIQISSQIDTNGLAAGTYVTLDGVDYWTDE